MRIGCGAEDGADETAAATGGAEDCLACCFCLNSLFTFSRCDRKPGCTLARISSDVLVAVPPFGPITTLPPGASDDDDKVCAAIGGVVCLSTSATKWIAPAML